MMHRDGAAAVPSARPGYPARAAASAIPAMPLSLHRWRAEDAHRRRQSGEKYTVRRSGARVSRHWPSRRSMQISASPSRQRSARIRIPPASVPPSSAPLKRPPVNARARRQAERAPASVVSAAKSALASKAMLAISAAALQIRIRHLRRREDTDEVSEMFIEPVHDL